MKIILLILLLVSTVSAEVVELSDGHEYVQFTSGYGKCSKGFLAHSGECSKCLAKEVSERRLLLDFLKRKFDSLKIEIQKGQ